jgi:hypothetical protein
MLTTPKEQDSNCTISYILERLNALDMAKLIPFFADLPIDPYLEGNYRFRRLSHFRISDHRLVQLPHTAMFQSKTYNSLLGNVVREYADLDPELINLPDFQALILEFFEFCQRCSTSNEVGVHQIRITADQGVGNPAPEGIHRDGVDIIGIICVNRDGVAGGETHLYESKDRSPVFTKVLNPGELLVVNDHQLFHFTTPIQARSPGAGVRDVFVFTCPGLPASNR